jgi:hypothetical protein
VQLFFPQLLSLSSRFSSFPSRPCQGNIEKETSFGAASSSKATTQGAITERHSDRPSRRHGSLLLFYSISPLLTALQLSGNQQRHLLARWALFTSILHSNQQFSKAQVIERDALPSAKPAGKSQPETEPKKVSRFRAAKQGQVL